METGQLWHVLNSLCSVHNGSKMKSVPSRSMSTVRALRIVGRLQVTSEDGVPLFQNFAWSETGSGLACRNKKMPSAIILQHCWGRNCHVSDELIILVQCTFSPALFLCSYGIFLCDCDTRLDRSLWMLCVSSTFVSCRKQHNDSVLSFQIHALPGNIQRKATENCDIVMSISFRVLRLVSSALIFSEKMYLC